MCLKFALGHVKQCLPDLDIIACMTLVIYKLKISSYISLYIHSILNDCGVFFKENFYKVIIKAIY